MTGSQFSFILSSSLFIIMPPKSKRRAKKSNGVDSAHSKRQSKKSAKQSQVPGTLQQDLDDIEDEATGDEELPAPLQGIVHRMDLKHLGRPLLRFTMLSEYRFYINVFANCQIGSHLAKSGRRQRFMLEVR